MAEHEPALEAFPDRELARTEPVMAHPAWPELERLVDEHYAAVFALLLRLVARREDAEDLAQECFVRAQGARSEKPAGPVRAYLLRTAVNLANDFFRRRGRRAEQLGFEVGQAFAEHEPSGLAQERELDQALRRAIAGLPDPPRSSFVSRVLEGRAYEQVAKDLGYEPGTVRIHVMKARRMLLELLAGHLELGS